MRLHCNLISFIFKFYLKGTIKHDWKDCLFSLTRNQTKT